jgi:hypothetical protein
MPPRDGRRAANPKARFTVDLTPNRIHERLGAYADKLTQETGAYVSAAGLARQFIDENLPTAEALGLTEEQ